MVVSKKKRNVKTKTKTKTGKRLIKGGKRSTKKDMRGGGDRPKIAIPNSTLKRSKMPLPHKIAAEAAETKHRNSRANNPNLVKLYPNLSFYVPRPIPTPFGTVTKAAIRAKFLGTSGVPRDLQFEQLRQMALYDNNGNLRILKKGNKKSQIYESESLYELPYSTIYNKHNSSV